MVYMIRFSYEHGRCLGSADRTPSNEAWYEPPISSDGIIEDWMRDYFPKVIQVDPSKGPLMDVLIVTGGMYCISQRVKDLVETLEPDLHQFLDVELQYGSEKHVYYLLRFGISEDFFDLEKSDIAWRSISLSDGKTIKFWHKMPTIPLTLKKEKVQGIHLWQGTGAAGVYKMISNEMYELFKAHDISGMIFEKQIIA